VIQRHLSFGRRGLVLCGASVRTGVTVTAASLAVALAEAGVSTLLIEANLRRPELDTLIRPASPGPGLLQFLRGEVDRYGAISMNVLDNLAVVFAGGVAADADELLAARRFHEFADAAMRDFECVIVETPPANRYADARTVAVAVGYAAIIARRQFSFVGDAELLARQLRDDGVVVVGSIFNRG
jgi:protein-tyrosine kinase